MNSFISSGFEGEDVVLEAVIRWLGHDASNRQPCVKEVLSLVRLSHVSQTVVDEFRTVMADNNGREVDDI